MRLWKIGIQQLKLIRHHVYVIVHHAAVVTLQSTLKTLILEPLNRQILLRFPSPYLQTEEDLL